MKRRTFIAQVLGAAGAVVVGARALGGQRFGRQGGRFLRPPRAVSEDEFRSRCIGCAKCMEVCVNDCIRMLGPEAGVATLRTPAIVPRSKGCTLCMDCTRVCPTGALQPIAEDVEVTRDTVSMGVAVLSEGVCFSYSGRTCGVCYKACPLPGKAMTIGLYEQPTIHPEACVGCGLCEQACLHLPTAILVRDTTRVA